jgi:hypothetical protein
MGRADLSFGYAQSRLQARLGARPSAGDWQQLEATRDLGATLQVLRGGPLRRWTERLPARVGLHDMERRLRDEWRQAVSEVADWQPAHWREATLWMRWISYLPALQKLARGGRPRDWMRADPVLGPLVAREPRERVAALAGMQLAPLARGFGAAPDVTRAWTEHWQSLWPAAPAARRPLELLLAAMRRHRERLATAPAGATSRDSLLSLEHELERIFRRNPLSPAATASYVCLMMLELQRLRGLLAVRSLRDATVEAA